jgi:hypothetical protein
LQQVTAGVRQGHRAAADKLQLDHLLLLLRLLLLLLLLLLGVYVST